MTPKDQLRFAVLVAVLSAVGIFSLVEGLDRSDGRGAVLVILAALIFVSLAGLAARVLRIRQQERGLGAEERAAARAARMEQARQSRPAWLESRGFGVLMLVFAAYWGYWTVVALTREAYGPAAAAGTLFLVGAAAVRRTLLGRRQKVD